MIDRDDLAKLMYVNEHGETPGFKAFAIDGLFEVREAGDGRRAHGGGRRGPARGPSTTCGAACRTPSRRAPT